MNREIPFAPPDITRKEIRRVVEVLKSGWITTGLITKQFEEAIASYCGTEKAIALSSATAGLELTLRLIGIGEGDEVITTPYTFAATSNVILHTGAKPVFVDIKEEDFNIDPKNIEKAINNKTKAIIVVDFGGLPCDYDEIKSIIEERKVLFTPKKNTLQEAYERIVLIADSAHSFGAEYKGKKAGNFADFNVFSFHAVKNITTAEGGAVTFNSLDSISAEEIYRKFKLLSLHGQNKDAFLKFKSGNWYYEIEEIGYKYNLTDIASALGLAQLERYDNEILPRRIKICEFYNSFLKDDPFILPTLKTRDKISSYHLFPLRIKNIGEKVRNSIIEKMAEKGISLNVHFIPVVMHPAYRRLGYRIEDFPVAYKCYSSEISLPVHSKMNKKNTYFLCNELKKIVKSMI